MLRIRLGLEFWAWIGIIALTWVIFFATRANGVPHRNRVPLESDVPTQGELEIISYHWRCVPINQRISLGRWDDTDHWHDIVIDSVTKIRVDFIGPVGRWYGVNDVFINGKRFQALDLRELK